jgi:flagellar secretion chaperone FliS
VTWVRRGGAVAARPGVPPFLACDPRSDRIDTPLKLPRGAPIKVHPGSAERDPVMFAATASLATAERQAGAYRQMHAATGVQGASPHALVTMLFDGLVGALAEARGAIRNRNVALKGRAIGRAVRIVDEGLGASLNLDEGGKIAADLGALYRYISLRLTCANLHNDEAALDECLHLIEPVRAAWAGIAGLEGA